MSRAPGREEDTPARRTLERLLRRDEAATLTCDLQPVAFRDG
jgi:hypothetical protein